MLHYIDCTIYTLLFTLYRHRMYSALVNKANQKTISNPAQPTMDQSNPEVVNTILTNFAVR